MTKLRICLVSSEVAPFAKTGGLADVAAALPRYLASRGHDVRVFMPFYGAVDVDPGQLERPPILQDMALSVGEGQHVHLSAVTTVLPASDVPVYMLRCPELFDGDKIYTSYSNEHQRFAVLSRATIECCQRMQWGPDIFHCNDWHAALLPLYLKTLYAWDELLRPSRTVLTIHNIGYQGVFSLDVLEELGLEGQRHLLPQEDVRNGTINFLRTGVVYADALTTVSRTYADEIQTAEFGMGLEDTLRQHRSKLIGIVNGVEYGDWDPAVDELIPHRYSAAAMAGKAANRRDLLADFGLELDAQTPLVGVVARLTAQKGFDLLPEVLGPLLQRGRFGLIVLGSGEAKYERFFQQLRDRFPRRIAFYRGYHNELAHRIEAASDIFLMPSRYEPCGLNQMYSLRYGTVPVVRRTGGLADTVEPFDPATGKGTGFVFEEFSAAALAATLQRAFEVFTDRAAWRRLMKNGMAQDFSWQRQGRTYEDLFMHVAGRRAGTT